MIDVMAPDSMRYPRTILATCCVPWNADGSLAEDIFRDSIRLQIADGFRDLYIFGTAGEGYAVSDRQFDTVTRVFVDETRQAGVSPMVGVISLSLTTIIERIERAAAMGVTAFQISLPSWGALNDAELARFFDETCGRFPELSFLHYNLSLAKRLVTPDEYAGLAARHPNLVATKYGSADYATVIGLLTKASAIRHFLTDLGFGYGSLVGECGFLISLAAVHPARARAYFDAGKRRDAATLAAMGTELAGMVEALKRAVGPGAHMDGAYDKIFARMRDPRFPLRLLPPYQGASEAAFERFVATLRERFPQWVSP